MAFFWVNQKVSIVGTKVLSRRVAFDVHLGEYGIIYILDVLYLPAMPFQSSWTMMNVGRVRFTVKDKHLRRSMGLRVHRLSGTGVGLLRLLRSVSPLEVTFFSRSVFQTEVPCPYP